MTGAALYLFAGLAALGAAWWFGLDHDAGGYQDRYFGDDPKTGKTIVMPDKAQHAGISFVLAFLAGWLMPFFWAAVITLALGIGWEVMQSIPRGKARGFFSWRDVVADASGCAMAYLIHLGIRAIFG